MFSLFRPAALAIRAASVRESTETQPANKKDKLINMPANNSLPFICIPLHHLKLN
jgi:hypothetical protein